MTLMKFDFTESTDKIIITIYISPKDNHIPEIKLEDSNRISIDGQEVTLCGNVHSPKKILSTRTVEFILEKSEKKKWNRLSIDEEVEPVSKRDALNNIVYSEDEEQKKNNEDIFELLRDVYEKDGDDVKNAMNESLRESNGTVLSTDWNNIKNKQFRKEE